MFRRVPLSIISSSSLYTQRRYTSYRFADSLRAGSGRSVRTQTVSKPVWRIPLLCVQWRTPDDGQRNCPKHVEFYYKKLMVYVTQFVWHTPSLCVQWRTPDDGQRNCQKHVEFYYKNEWYMSYILYDIYHCCVYSEELLMLDRGTVRNM